MVAPEYRQRTIGSDSFFIFFEFVSEGRPLKAPYIKHFQINGRFLKKEAPKVFLETLKSNSKLLENLVKIVKNTCERVAF